MKFQQNDPGLALYRAHFRSVLAHFCTVPVQELLLYLYRAVFLVWSGLGLALVWSGFVLYRDRFWLAGAPAAPSGHQLQAGWDELRQETPHMKNGGLLSARESHAVYQSQGVVVAGRGWTPPLWSGRVHSWPCFVSTGTYSRSLPSLADGLYAVLFLERQFLGPIWS